MASTYFIEETDVWLDKRIPYLLDIPAKHRRVSLKPFIGEVDIAPYLAAGKIETVYQALDLVP